MSQREAIYEEALKEIRDLPSEHDLLLNPMARATFTIAINALAAGISEAEPPAPDPALAKRLNADGAQIP